MAGGMVKRGYGNRQLASISSNTTTDCGKIDEYNYIVIRAYASSTTVDEYFRHVSEFSSDSLTFLCGNYNQARSISVSCSIDSNGHLIATTSSRTSLNVEIYGII